MSVDPDRLRDAFGSWASGVSVVACRVEARVVATTVSAFLSLSIEHALVLIALGPNATVLPFLQEGVRFTISVLTAAQRRLAEVFADPFAVSDPFPEDGDPLIPDALVQLVCEVRAVRSDGDHVVVTAMVLDVARRGDAPPLIRYRRRYHALHS